MNREEQLDQVLAEYIRRVDAGEHVDREHFLHAHPELADDLDALLATADRVEQMAGPVVGCEQADVEPGQEVEHATDPDLHETVTHAPKPASSSHAPAERLPRQCGDYELLDVVGRGGMGVVYKARQVNLNRLVAVKMILEGRLASQSDVQRFQIEAQAAGRLSHPNLVTIHEIGELDGRHFYSMDYIDGISLAQLVKEGPQDSKRAARYLATIAEAIHAAHDHGILHRDLKPGNVLIDRDDEPHVTDFGLAKLVGDDSGLTASGATLGTPSYMPPEQAAGNRSKVNRTSDVYSLGAILYALLTGQPPFRKETVVETMFDVIHTDPTPPRAINSEVDRDLETICLKCLQKRPGRRYQTAQELADDLGRYLRDEPILAKPVGRMTHAVRWIRNVPMIAAATGGRAVKPSRSQLRANAAIILILLMSVVAFTLYRVLPRPLPRRIRIASAAPGGVYHDFGEAFGRLLGGSTNRTVRVLPTGGSVENARLLLSRDTEVALLQENAITDERIAVVAPLYDEAVHLVVRKGRKIASLDELAGKNVWLGRPESGMRLSAMKILEAQGIFPAESLGDSDAYFTDLPTDEAVDAAIITIGPQDDDLQKLLASGQFELLSLEDQLIERLSRYPSFRPHTIRRGSFQAESTGAPIPRNDVHTLATTTFLTVRRDAPDVLVTRMLRSLYGENTLVQDFGLITAEDAVHWREYALHPAASEFFSSEE